jgi:hypothetical protein
VKAEFIVARYIPRDIHRYSHAAAATVLLAAALDWNVIERPNRATLLRSSDGEVVIEVPDHENLKFNVFRSWIRKLATHTVEFVLPMDVATQIADTAKLGPDHKRVLIDLAEQSVIPDATPDAIDEPAEEVFLVSREPYKAHLKPSTTYESGASYERIWSDGHRDYECVVCGDAFPSPKSLGGHRQKHIAAGEAEADHKDRIRDSVKGVDPDWVSQHREPATPAEPPAEPEPEVVPEEVVPELEGGPELEPGPPVLATELLQHSLDGVIRYVEAVLTENEDLRRRLAKMRADLAAMFSLLEELQRE